MKKFKFRLEKLLDMKAEAERQRQMALAEANMKVGREEEALRLIQASHQAGRQGIETLRSGGRFSPQEMDQRYRYLKKLEADMVIQRRRIKEAIKAADQCRVALLEAAKERKMLENLKGRQEEAYLGELTRKEQAMIDDLTITHYGNEKE